MILECNVEQEPLAPNDLLANNLYHLQLLAHCVAFITWPAPATPSNAFAAAA